MSRTSQITVRQASASDIELVIPLFDAYRQFYRQPSDRDLAKQFLLERIQQGESTVLLAMLDDASAVGFAQMYPSFSSVSGKRIVILNDLFVAPEARRMSIARLLLRAAARFARDTGAIRMTLSTEVTNVGARALYEAEDWKLQTEFCAYDLPLHS